MKNGTPPELFVKSSPYTLVPLQKKEDSLEKNCIIPIETTPTHLGILVAREYIADSYRIICTDVQYFRTGKKNFCLHFESVSVEQNKDFFIVNVHDKIKIQNEVLPSPSKMPYLIIELTKKEYQKTLQKNSAHESIESIVQYLIPIVARNKGFTATRKKIFFGPYELTAPETYARYEALWISLPNKYLFNGERSKREESRNII